jgi:histidinol-phosphate/aromatic aminotransferase/cobyric acid decarboxylase-like protein
MSQVYHGGASLDAIGADLIDLGKADGIVNADVLDAWFDPSPRILEKIRNFLPLILRTSPPLYADGLRQAISQARGIPREHIVVSNGSTELIFQYLLSNVTCGQRVLILDPMYGEYQHVLSNLIGAVLLRHELKEEEDFKINIDTLVSDVHQCKPHLLIIVNPNSPTGQHCPRGDLVKLLRKIPRDVTVLIDETYVEYVGREFSMEADVLQFDNLVIVKSMSKVYALSGVRVGYLVARQPTVESMSAALPPWHVSFVAQVAGIEALSDETYYASQYARTVILRENMTQSLLQLPFLKVYPSVANFVLVRIMDDRMRAEELVEAMKRLGVYIRDASSMSTRFAGQLLRIAVKEEPQQQRILDAMRIWHTEFSCQL